MESTTTILELLKCSICLQELVSPLTLPCNHSFCKRCIKAIAKKNRVKCFRCFKEFSCTGGIEKLFRPSDLMPFIEKINNKYFETHDYLNEFETREEICHECNSNSKKVKTQKCFHCKSYLCENCTTNHYNKVN